MSERKPFSDSPNTLRVLDVGTMLAGPFAATLFGDFGADVIKVERPDGGEITRGESGLGDLFQVNARNKRSITLNMRVAEGQALVRRLACWADVLVENFRPGTMDKWGLGYKDLSALNPRLVYVSASAFGQTGPRKDGIGYDHVGAGFGGLTYLTGFPDRPPVLPGMPVSDFTTALFCAVGALEALRRRDGPGGSGVGEWVDCALYEPLIRISEEAFIRYGRTGQIKQRSGSMPVSDKPLDAVHGFSYQTRDGRWLALVAVSDQQLRNLGELIGDPIFNAPEILNFETRTQNYHRVDPAIRQWIAERDYEEAEALLRKADVPVSPIFNTADIANDPHVQARENLVRIKNPRGEELLMQGVVPRLVNNPGSVRWSAEELGASNEDVYLGLLGMDRGEYEGLKARGVI
jgi:crotonobetainyl-CoA:carnitine CoA-transferase CaiB-like acyl-CoA transferase